MNSCLEAVLSPYHANRQAVVKAFTLTLPIIPRSPATAADSIHREKLRMARKKAGATFFPLGPAEKWALNGNSLGVSTAQSQGMTAAL